MQGFPSRNNLRRIFIVEWWTMMIIDLCRGFFGNSSPFQIIRCWFSRLRWLRSHLFGFLWRRIFTRLPDNDVIIIHLELVYEARSSFDLPLFCSVFTHRKTAMYTAYVFLTLCCTETSQFLLLSQWFKIGQFHSLVQCSLALALRHFKIQKHFHTP